MTVNSKPGMLGVGKLIGSVLILAAIAGLLGGCEWLYDLINPDEAPVAVISASLVSGEAPLEVTLDASGSYDPDGGELSFEWDFGDGSAATGSVVHHGFTSAGSYAVKLIVVDAGGKPDGSSVVISVHRPPDETSEEESFDEAKGIAYDTGTGLKIVVPASDDMGTARLVVTENPTPQPLDGDVMELHSVYSVSLVQGTGSQEKRISHRSDGGSDSSVTLTFEIPAGVDPGSANVLLWTDEGWVLAVSGDSTDVASVLGGVLSPDGRSKSIEVSPNSLAAGTIEPQGPRDWWESITVALGEFKDDMLSTFDCSPIYPSMSVETFETESGAVKKIVSLHSPKRGFGGIWFELEVLGSESLADTPRWEPPGRNELEKWLLDRKGRYLSPTETREGTLELVFPPQGGTVTVSLDAAASLKIQIASWIIGLIPFGDLSESAIESVWALVDNAIRSVGVSQSTRWSEVAEKTVGLVWEIAKKLPDLASKLWKEGGKQKVAKVVAEVLKPLSIVFVIANQITYNWTILSSQGEACEHGYCSWEVTYTPTNRRPIAEAGADQYVRIGTLVTLDGTGSRDEDDGDRLVYHWVQTDGEHTVDLSTDASNPRASFTPGTPGDYEFRLVVNDGKADSEPAFVYVTAIARPDLSAGSVSVSESAVGVGDSITVTFTVRNSGGPPQSEFHNRLFMSTTEYGGGGQRIPIGEWLMAMGESSSRTETVDVTIPQIPGGDWYLAIFVDCADAVEELNEGNNINSTSLRVAAHSAVLERLTITGLSSVNENTSADYTCTAYFSDDTNSDVTGSASWSENSSYASMSGRQLNVRSVSSDRTCSVTASYEYNGVTKSASKSVTLKDVPVAKVLDRVTISGPSQVDEDRSGDYTCTAHFRDGTSAEVTGQASWRENSSYTTISGGRLSVGGLSSDKTCTVTASYTYNSVTESGSKSVTLKDAPPLTPRVTGTDPARPVAHTGRKWLTILGADFVPQSQVILRIGTNEFPIPADRTEYVSSSRIRVYVGLRDPGTWSAQVINPGNLQSYIRSFTVVP